MPVDTRSAKSSKESTQHQQQSQAMDANIEHPNHDAPAQQLHHDVAGDDGRASVMAGGPAAATAAQEIKEDTPTSTIVRLNVGGVRFTRLGAWFVTLVW